MLFKKENLIDRLKKIVNPKIFLLVFLGIIFISVITLFVLLQRQIQVPKAQTYEILPGSSSREIAYDLAEKQIIKRPRLFNLYVKLKDLDTELQAGKFTFTSEQMTLKELIEFLAAGAVAHEIKFTIPEGYTVAQIGDLLVEKGLIEEDSLFQAFEQECQKPGADCDLSVFEGYLFPDTYRVFEGVTAIDIVQKMLDNFEHKVTAGMLAEIEQQGKSLEEIIIMASILEKEVRTSEDMQLVADILWRRLAADWLLQVDSSLNYILAEDERRAALNSDQLLIDSPYNTYKYQGFPPTPISNPGLKAIRAAIYPTVNDYWFYLSKPDGETVFARTYDEHLINKAKYLD